MWIEEPSGKRVNGKRVESALESGADILAVACPFCMTMLEDGAKARSGERELKVLDVAELVDMSASVSRQGISCKTPDPKFSGRVNL